MTADSTPRPATPKVSIIIVTYCSADEIVPCVERLLSQQVALEIFLIDNASPDNTRAVVEDLCTRSPNISSILNTENVGLAAANNQALARCRGDYVLILNPDTLLCAGALRSMLDFLDANPGIGVLGPLNQYPDGSPHRSFHSGWGLLHVALWRVAPYSVARTLYDRLSSYRKRDVLFVSGACLLIRNELFQRLQGYDPNFFLTVEDACDLCIRAKQAGSRVTFFPGAAVVHVGGRSGQHAPYTVVWRGYEGTIHFFLKHRGILQAEAVWAMLSASALARCAAGAALGLLRRRYRPVARIYGRVFLGLANLNPASRSRKQTSTAPQRAAARPHAKDGSAFSPSPPPGPTTQRRPKQPAAGQQKTAPPEQEP